MEAKQLEKPEIFEPLKAEGYEDLAFILEAAFNQAAHGKGNDRHANGKPFSEQPIMKLQELYGPGFALGQIAKKAEECQRMEVEAAVKELLGVIVYASGAILHFKKHGTPASRNDG